MVQIINAISARRKITAGWLKVITGFLKELGLVLEFEDKWVLKCRNVESGVGEKNIIKKKKRHVIWVDRNSQHSLERESCWIREGEFGQIRWGQIMEEFDHQRRSLKWLQRPIIDYRPLPPPSFPSPPFFLRSGSQYDKSKIVRVTSLTLLWRKHCKVKRGAM